MPVVPDDETSVTAAERPRSEFCGMSDDFDPAVVTDLDVRELIARGLQPLPLILELADALAPGHVLHLRSPFQPAPLYGVLAERGFAYKFASFAEDDWSSWFWRTDHPPPAAAARATERQPPPDGVTDLRWLAPPEPLLWVMRWTSENDNDELRVMLPFFPAPLQDLISGSGWQVSLESERDDGVVVRIHR